LKGEKEHIMPAETKQAGAEMPSQAQTNPGLKSVLYFRRQLMPPGYRRSSKLSSQVAIVASGEPGFGRVISVLFAL